MAGKRKLSPIAQQYRKERKRIQNQMRRMEKRGYIFEKNPLPSIPKKITAGSVRRLEQLTTKKLYEKAIYVDRQYGDVLSGQQGRALERKASAAKASRTLKQKNETKKYIAKLISDNRKESDKRYKQRKEERKKRDEESKRRIKQEKEFYDRFSRGSEARSYVSELLDEKERGWPNMVAELRRAIREGEAREGTDAFWERIADYPELFDDLDETFYYEGDHIRPSSFNRVLSLFNDSPLSGLEARAAQDKYESDVSYNYVDPDEEWD